MSSGDLAFLISGISLAVALVALAWHIWEKFIFVRPRLQVSFGVFQILQGGKFGKSLLSLTATNMGPGPAIIHCCIVQMRTRWFWKKQLGILKPIHNDPASDVATSIGPFSSGLPLKLDAGEVKSFYFPFTAETFLREPITRVGVTDTYGRNAWCRGGDVKKASRRFKKEFPNASAQADVGHVSR